MNIENGINAKEQLNPVSIEEPTYIYKRSGETLTVPPEDEKRYSEAVTAFIAAKNQFENDRESSEIIEEYVEKFWRSAYENLPEIPAGYVRLLHHTFSSSQAEGIRQNGLRYGGTTMGSYSYLNKIAYTANIVRDMNERDESGNRILYNSRVEIQKEGVVVIFDLPEEDFKKYEYNNGAPGVIPAEFFVAALPERTPIVWIDYEKRIFAPLSQRFNEKP